MIWFYMRKILNKIHNYLEGWIKSAFVADICYINSRCLKKFFFLTIIICLTIVQPTSVLTKASVWYEIEELCANIIHVKIHAMALGFILQTDMNQVFQMRYCTLLQGGAKVKIYVFKFWLNIHILVPNEG